MPAESTPSKAMEVEIPSVPVAKVLFSGMLGKNCRFLNSCIYFSNLN
jgi:putative component of membrane protein insertase Oxa1/YidC/SpoIIIJ protein YidD